METGKEIAPENTGKRRGNPREAYAGESLLDQSDSDNGDTGMDVDTTAALAAKMRIQSSSSSVFELNTGTPSLRPLQSAAHEPDRCPMPDEYARARTARRFDADPHALPGIGPFTRSGEVGSKGTTTFACGSFDAIPDKRLGEVIKVHSVSRKSNYTLSFDPEKLMCTACKIEHPVIGKNPVCIVLTDQNFPPPTSPVKTLTPPSARP